MSVQNCPDAKEVQDFQFKLICRLNVFADGEFRYNGHLNLVATASKYGLAFVGYPGGVQAIHIASVLNIGALNNKTLNEYPRRNLQTPGQPTHLALSCDHSLLVIGTTKDKCAHAVLYSVPSILSKNIVLVSELRLSASPDTHILELTWNPGVANVLGSCLSDGSIGIYEFKTGGTDINTLPSEAQAKCFAWSPRGKQLVVGTSSGELTQYKPDLKAVKTISAPKLTENSVAVINIDWISTYQFVAVYRDKDNENERPVLMVVNAPKTGPVSFINFDDICYSSGDLRSPQFYLLHQPTWKVMIVASANSMEVGVMGLMEDQISWQQWIQEDACRAELPMSSDKQETFPIGLALDTSTRTELPWGDNQTIPPMPVLHILSHKGVLCLFYAINISSNAATICSPPEKVADQNDLSLFTTKPPELTPATTNVIGPRINLTQKFENLDGPKPVQPTQSLQTSLTFRDTNNLSVKSTISEPGIAALQTAFPAQQFPASTAVTKTFSAPKVSFVPSSEPFSFNTGGIVGKVPTASMLQLTAVTTPAAVGIQQTTTTAVVPPLATVTPSTGNLTFAASASSPFTVAQSPLKAQFTPVRPSFTEKPAPEMTVATPSTEMTTGVIRAAIIEENQHFQQEINNLKKRVAAVNTNIGSLEERLALQKKVEHLEEFCHELEETTRAQTSEVQALKCLIMETFVWVEDAKSRHQKLSKPTEFVELPVLRELDPVISHYWSSIQHLMFYVENQLKQLNQALDLDWLSYQNARKDKGKSALQVNNLEAVYRVMTLENNIIIKKRTELEKIIKIVDQRRNKQGKHTSLLSAFNSVKHRAVDKGENDIARLAEKLLHSKLSDADMDGPDTVKKLMSVNRLATVSAKNKKLGVKKQSTLHNLLTQHISSHVTPTKTVRDKYNTSSSILNLASPFSNSVSKPGGISSGRPVISSDTITVNRQNSAEKTNMYASEVLTNLQFSSLSNDKGSSYPTSPLVSLSSMVAGAGTPSQIVTSQHSFNKPSVQNFSQNIVLNSASGNLKSLSTEASTFPISMSVSQPSTAFTFGSSFMKGSNVKFVFGGTPNSDTSKEPTFFGSSTSSTSSSSTSSTLKSSTQTPSLFGNLRIPATDSSAKSGETFPTFSKSEIVAPTNKNMSTETTHTLFGTINSQKTVPSAFSFASGASVSSNFSFQRSSHTGESSSLFGKSISDQQPKSDSLVVPLMVPTTGTQSSIAMTQSQGSSKNTSGLLNLTQSSSVIQSSQQVSQAISSSAVTPSVFGIGQHKTSSASTMFSFGQIGASIKNIKEKESAQTTETTSISQTVLNFNVPQKIGSPFGQPGITVSSSAVETPQASPETIESTGAGTVSGTLSASSSTGSVVSEEAESAKSVVPPTPVVSEVSATNTASSTSVTGVPSFSLSISDSKPNSSEEKQTISSTSSSETFFGQAICNVSSSKPGTTNIFAQASASKTDFGNLSTTAASLFGMSSPASTSSSMLFGSQSTNLSFFGTPSTSMKPVSSSTSLFGGLSTVTTAVADSSPLSATTPSAPSDLVTTTSTESSSFLVTSESQAVSTSPSLSVSAAITTSVVSTSTEPSTTCSTTGSPLGATEATVKSTTTSSLFGGATFFGNSTATTASSLFGSSTTTSATTASLLFGALSLSPSTTTASSFGSLATTTATTAPSVFSGIVGTSAGTTSLLGNSNTTAVNTSGSQTTLFGGAGATTSAPSLFGGSTITASSTTLFGTGSSVTSATVSAPLFGSVTSTVSTSAPSFGGSGAAIFGAANPASSTTSLFGTSQNSETTSSSLFGGSSGTGVTPVFGGSTDKPSLFGSAQTNASSVFGKPVFGQPAATTTAAPFGQTSNIFGQSSPSAFGGSGTAGFGSKAVFGQSGGSVFGQTPRFGFGGSSFGGGTSLFGGSSPSGNSFQPTGGSAGSLFGGASTSQANNTFSAGAGQGVGQTGFGSSAAFQNKPGGFGSPPAFGGSSPGNTTAFGASPTFGGAPTFGGSPTFGSSSRIFGSPSAGNTGFGASPTGQQQSSTFESLASQNTLTFGNLANQSPGFGSPQPSLFGGSQPSSPNATPAFSSGNSGGTTFGGSSFSSWR